jgi:hypothetical protein
MKRHHVTDLDTSPGNARNSEGAMVTLADGRVMLAYTRYGPGGSDADKAVIAARFSDDGGRTWSTRDRILVRDEGRENDMSVSLLRLHDGRIAMFNLRKDSLYDCRPMVRFSTDEAQTFSKPIPLTPAPGYYILNNDRVIQLRSGRLVAPLALHHARAYLEVHEGPPHTRATHFDAGLLMFLFSDDGGANWQESRSRLHHCDHLSHGLQEPGVVELSRGRLWAWARHGTNRKPDPRNRQWQSFSHDSGLTWSDIGKSRFISPCSPMSVKRLDATGDLLAIWNDHSPGSRPSRVHPRSVWRTPLACAISADQGKTWRKHQLLETSTRHGFCYVAIHCVQDAVLLAYCAGGPETNGCLRRLRIRCLPLADLYR